MHETHSHAHDAHHDEPLDILHGEETSYGPYIWGLGLAIVLTLCSFAADVYHWVWEPGLPILLGVLAIAQMGVHLVFFMHVSPQGEHKNTLQVLLLGVLLIGLVVFGSLIIMSNLSGTMPTMDELMNMQR
jgi:cytochrome o ubiquinol oxidase operon protein cyoD